MIVVGIDTATWTATVGVVRDGVVLAEVTRRESRSHAASLPALVQEALARAAIGIDAVDALAVSIGPGSFTGLRIGLGLAKGFAYAGGLPIVPVSTLEALACAAAAPAGTTVCAAIDARMQEVYAATFLVEDRAGCRRLGPDEALRPMVLAERLGASVWLVGDASDAYPEVFAGRADIRPFATVGPRGGVVARLGWDGLRAGRGRGPGEVEPAYVRLPQVG